MTHSGLPLDRQRRYADCRAGLGVTDLDVVGAKVAGRGRGGGGRPRPGGARSRRGRSGGCPRIVRILVS